MSGNGVNQEVEFSVSKPVIPVLHRTSTTGDIP
jgi:hypothetical protein